MVLDWFNCLCALFTDNTINSNTNGIGSAWAGVEIDREVNNVNPIPYEARIPDIEVYETRHQNNSGMNSLNRNGNTISRYCGDYCSCYGR